MPHRTRVLIRSACRISSLNVRFRGRGDQPQLSGFQWSAPNVNLHRGLFRCVRRFLPSRVEASMVATKDDASLAHPGAGLARGGSRNFSSRSRRCADEKIPAILAAPLLQSAPHGVRFQLCINGRDPRGLTTKGEQS
jgi:hypothetical protein